MIKKIFLACILFITCHGLLPALEQEDQYAIQKIIQGHKTSWNEKGGHGFADGFTEDADFVNIFGMKFSGREEIENRHIKIIQTIFKGSFFEILDVTLRKVTPGLVIAIVKWRLEGFRKPGSEATETREGIFTHVFINQRNKWEITATQNTLFPN